MPELPHRVDRIVLIGFMGAGKTTVGQLLAARLGWRFLDLDRSIEAKTGLSVAQIFANQGEETFRRLEQQLTAELASAERTVLAPGGGWPLRDENVRALPPGSAVLWLRVSAPEAVRRLSRAGQARPLLMQADPLERAVELEAQRAGRYAEIGWPVETEQREPVEVANEILRILGDRVQTHEPASN